MMNAFNSATKALHIHYMTPLHIHYMTPLTTTAVYTLNDKQTLAIWWGGEQNVCVGDHSAGLYYPYSLM